MHKGRIQFEKQVQVAKEFMKRQKTADEMLPGADYFDPSDDEIRAKTPNT